MPLDATPSGALLSHVAPCGVAWMDRRGVDAASTGAVRDVYDAVADPTRRALLDLLAQGGELPLHSLAARFPMGRTAVSKHLAILRAAGVVEARRVGRETRYRLNAAPLREIQRWISFYERFWTERVDRLRDLLEEGQK